MNNSGKKGFPPNYQEMTCINIDSLNNVPTSNYENSTSVTKTIRTCPSCGHLIKYEEKVSNFSFFNLLFNFGYL